MPTDPIALVTGGSRGLGRSTVEALARRGVSSILTYNSNRAAAEEVVTRVQQAGARTVALQLDTGDTGAFPGFADKVRSVLDEWEAERFNFLARPSGPPYGHVS